MVLLPLGIKRMIVALSTVDPLTQKSSYRSPGQFIYVDRFIILPRDGDKVGGR